MKFHSKQTLDTLRTGVPLVLAALVGMAGNPWLGAVCGLIVMTLCWACCARRMKNVDVVVWLAFPLQLLVLALGFNQAWMPFFLPVMLVVLAFGSLVVGRPFTLPFAREQSDPEMWDNPHFYFVNRLLTAVWGMCFMGMCAAVWFWAIPWQRWAVSAACFVTAWLITKWFPKWYQTQIYLPRLTTRDAGR